MGYMGFGMRPELYKRKPKRFLGKRTGLFGRQLKDELTEFYHHDQADEAKSRDPTPISEKRKNLFYKGGTDMVVEIIALGLVIVIILFFLFTLMTLSH